MINQEIKIFKIIFKACLAITGAIQGTSRQKNYDELGLHTLIERRRRSNFLLLYSQRFITKISVFVSEIPFTRELPFKISINY